MSFSFSGNWYGAALGGQNPRLARAGRSWAGKISYAEISAPAGKAGKLAGCISVQESLTLWLDMPFPSKAKALKILPSMLDVQLPFPLEDCCYCFVQFRRKTPATLSVLAVAARRAAIQQRLDQYRAAGLDPLIIDHEGLALWQQSLREQPERAGAAARVILSLEPDHVAIVIGKENLFLNAHSFQAADDAIKSPETLPRLRRILAAELQPAGPVEWLFCGARAARRETAIALHNFLNKEWPGGMLVLPAPEFFLARALAARALTRASLACNLRHAALLHPALKAAQQRRSTGTARIFLLTGLLLCAFNLAGQLISSAQLRNAKQAIARLAGELSAGRAITYGREVDEVQPLINQRRHDLAPVRAMFAQPLSIRLAGIINAGKQADLSFTRLELSREKVLIAGAAEDWNYCAALVESLAGLGYKTELERREAEDDNGVRFIVKGRALEIEKSRGPP